MNWAENINKGLYFNTKEQQRLLMTPILFFAHVIAIKKPWVVA